MKVGDILWDGRDAQLCAIVESVDDAGRWSAKALWTQEYAMAIGMPVRFDRVLPALWICEFGSHARPN